MGSKKIKWGLVKVGSYDVSYLAVIGDKPRKFIHPNDWAALGLPMLIDATIQNHHPVDAKFNNTVRCASTDAEYHAQSFLAADLKGLDKHSKACVHKYVASRWFPNANLSVPKSQPLSDDTPVGLATFDGVLNLPSFTPLVPLHWGIDVSLLNRLMWHANTQQFKYIPVSDADMFLLPYIIAVPEMGRIVLPDKFKQQLAAALKYAETLFSFMAAWDNKFMPLLGLSGRRTRWLSYDSHQLLSGYLNRSKPKKGFAAVVQDLLYPTPVGFKCKKCSTLHSKRPKGSYCSAAGCDGKVKIYRAVDLTDLSKATKVLLARNDAFYLWQRLMDTAWSKSRQVRKVRAAIETLIVRDAATEIEASV